MDFQIIDMVIIGMVLFLAIKGLITGFSKELFSFLGLIGGIAVAARMNEQIGNLIMEQNILPEMLLPYQSIIGFVIVFLIIWVVFNILSSFFGGFNSDELGVISRIFGYFIAVARYAFIFTLILYGFNNADFFKEKLSKYTEKSQLFVPMSKIGEELLNRSNADQNQTVTSENNATLLEVNATVLKDKNLTQ